MHPDDHPTTPVDPTGTELLAFDLYDTVLDRVSTLEPALAGILDAHGADADAGVLLRRYLAMHFRDSLVDSLVGGDHTPFETITERALRYRLDQVGVPATNAEVRAFVESWRELDAYPDCVEPFERLADEYALVGLSNGDPGMLSAVTEDLAVPLDGWVSVAEAGRYKPNPAPYELLCDRYGVAPADVAFVSAHTFDTVGATAAGMAGVYLNRHDRPYGGWDRRPDLRVPDPAALADALL
ncbi:haloacid dehalogenase type II [Halobaculum gomorrense]|uniref:2-haloacid dehalogenase n=1 Tax=Halobaculum gomorrense TaxID=43928 RepID=A0A1M5JLA1_9EURY|nr:haloacid dehalogenase type II [Halobaculum gomorrense]SHG41311.1 2-haloacid dehalogenase [Halobaculum gomorrense]